MYLRLFPAILLAAVSSSAQAPAGRWDGIVQFGSLKVPFRIDFEGNANAFKGSLVNGDAQIPSTSGGFSDGKILLTFDRSGAKLEASLADGELKGDVKSASGTHPFTAARFCTCGFEGEAGPDIAGNWEVPNVFGGPSSAGWRLEIRRIGEDTLATIRHSDSEEPGPLSGRFDGLVFSLRYFDGNRAAMLEIEPNKSGGLDLVYTEPGKDAKKLKAISVKVDR